LPGAFEVKINCISLLKGVREEGVTIGYWFFGFEHKLVGRCWEEYAAQEDVCDVRDQAYQGYSDHLDPEFTKTSNLAPEACDLRLENV